MSVYLYGALWIGLACLGAGILLVLVHHFGDVEKREKHNDVNGLMFAIVGVLYAIVVGFVVTSQWQNVSAAQDAAAQESNGLVRVYWAAEPLPAQQRDDIRSLCRRYATTVKNGEWPQMAAHETVTGNGQQLLDRLGRDVHTATAADDDPNNQLGDALNDVLQNRQQRLALAHQNLSGMMWLVMLAGGVMTAALAYLFGVPSRLAHLVMVVALVGTVGLLLYASFQLQFPFGPATALRPTGMEAALRLFGPGSS
jgi:FtsH-binding integral membrane protein